MSAETLQSSLRFWATRWPDRLAIKCDGREVSWGQFDRDSDDIAAGLQALGIGPGDAVGILMSNRYEFAETMAGALKAGAAIVLLNLRYTAREMVHPLTDSRAKLVVTEDAYLPTLLEAAEQTPGLKVYTADGPAGVPTLAALKAGGGALTEVSVDGQDAAFICYTSGTTGLPKGAVLSHRSIYSSSASRAFALGQNFDDRVMMVLPLAFTGGAVGFFRDGVIPGSTMYLVSPNDAGELLALIGEDRITAMGAVPVVYENMMGHEAFASTDLTSLRYALTGGATPSLHLLST